MYLASSQLYTSQYCLSASTRSRSHIALGQIVHGINIIYSLKVHKKHLHGRPGQGHISPSTATKVDVEDILDALTHGLTRLSSFTTSSNVGPYQICTPCMVVVAAATTDHMGPSSRFPRTR